MTAYEYGFLTKCAELGFDADVSVELLKAAKSEGGKRDHLGGALSGARTGAIVGGSATGIPASVLGALISQEKALGLYQWERPSAAMRKALKARRASIPAMEKLMTLLKHGPKGALIMGAPLAALGALAGAVPGAAIGGAIGKKKGTSKSAEYVKAAAGAKTVASIVSKAVPKATGKAVAKMPVAGRRIVPKIPAPPKLPSLPIGSKERDAFLKWFDEALAYRRPNLSKVPGQMSETLQRTGGVIPKFPVPPKLPSLSDVDRQRVSDLWMELFNRAPRAPRA